MSEIAVRNDLPPQDWATMKEQAGMLVKTGFLPPALNTPEKVLAVSLKGRELGVPMMEALSSINIIQGKPTLSAQLMLALATRTGQLESFECPTNKDGATARCKRKGWPLAEVKFGPNEAKALGLDGKDNYKKQAATMYQWRATSAVLRLTFSDALAGIYTPEEMGADVDLRDDGSIEIDPGPPIMMPRSKSQTAQEPEPTPENPVVDAFPQIDAPLTDDDRTNFRKKFHAMGDQLGLSPDDKKKFLKAVTGQESTKDLSRAQYDALINRLNEAMHPPHHADVDA